MKKRLISVFLVIVVVLSCSFSAFAVSGDEKNALQWYFENQMLGVQKGTGVTLVCPKGDYKTLYTGGTLVSCPYDGEALVLADAGGVSAKPYQTGGGSAGTGGVGRNPSGYSGTGVPTYNADGEYQITVYPSLSPVGSSYLEDYPVDRTYNTNYASWNISGLTVSGRAVGTTSDRLTMSYAYEIVKPSVSGLYYIKTKQYIATHCLDSDLKTFRSYSIAANSYSSKLSSITTASSIIKSGNVLCNVAKPPNANSSVTSYFHPIVVTVIPDKSSVKQQTNITINQNTWNGNIYQDNSTNLTYIYPQYTTINENNETVTNISNNPIIYNNETKQYYTYDTVTNNYYYITYETPSPSPSPSPSPDPGTNPTPTPEPSETPTPTPAPGGDTGDTSSLLDVLIEIKDNMIQGFADIKATLVQGWADLSANFTLAIENLNVNIQNIFNKKFPDQSTPGTTPPSPTPSPSPEPIDPILPETQNLIIPKMNSNTFTDEHGTWVASGSSKYSGVFDFFYAFDRSTANFWETNASPSHLQIEIPDPESYYIDGYIMRISKFNNRYAKDWTLQGSDDGKTWDDLDKQTGQNLSDMEEHKYPLTLRKAYKYYRVNMSNYASSMCSLSHFNLLGYDAKDVVTPTPSPSPAPDPGTDPTPVPTPSGGTVPAPGGDSNISGGDDEGLFGWLWDLLKDLVKAILKAIFKILSNILGFLIWIVERVGLLLPFLPAPAIAALGAGVVLIFVIRIIRFIRG